jgi:hypothetical protein
MSNLTYGRPFGRLAFLVSAIAGLLLLAAGQAAAATLSVCHSGCQYSELAPAVGAAHDGDTIAIGPGTYAGGVTIDVSIAVVGAGKGSTIISGGGPVLTIGTFGATNEPTVSIDGLTITGGVTRTSPESTPFVGEEGVIALGGGVEIPPNANFSGGATVTITDSAISGNRVAPTATLPFGPPCPGGPCPFAWAKGGGIDSWGTLTLDHATVSDNRVGSASGLSKLASDAQGAGIMSWLDALTIKSSVISGNVAGAAAPNGRFAEGGGIWIDGGTVVTMRDSFVTNNTAVLNAALPASVELAAQPGGIFVADGVSRATITNTVISGNAATMTNSAGDATAFAGGINVGPDVNFQMANSVVADNTVTSMTLPGSHGDAEGDTGGGALLGTITNTRITGNTVTVRSAAGDALSGIGGLLQFGALTNSVVTDNRLVASSPRGAASVLGAGVMVAEQPLTLRNTTVSGNTGEANGRHAVGRGGGIYDGPFFDIPGSTLTLLNSSVTGNSLSGSAGGLFQGGGLYLQNQPLTSTNSSVARNSPDQCFGC